VKLLAISKAGQTAVNREIYSTLYKKYGYQITLVIPKYLMIGNKKIGCDSFDNLPYKVIALTMLGSDRLSRYKGIFKVLKFSKADIIYFEDDPMTLLAVSLGIWCKWNNKKFICRTNQNRFLTVENERSRLGFLKGLFSATIKLFLLQISKRLMDHLFVISNDGTQVFTQLGLTNHTKIPLGFDEDKFRINDKERERIRSDLNLNGIVISYMGRILEGKGVHILIEALNRIREHEWTFLIDSFELYSDPYKKNINTLIQSLGLKDRTIFFDADHFQIASYMNASDIVVLPSITTNHFKEEYGRIAPEAMGSGCLVVVSNSGTLPELVSEFGWIFQEGSISELENLLKKLIYEKNKKALKEKASEFAHKNLGLNKQALIMDRVFQSVIRK